MPRTCGAEDFIFQAVTWSSPCGPRALLLKHFTRPSPELAFIFSRIHEDIRILQDTSRPTVQPYTLPPPAPTCRTHGLLQSPYVCVSMGNCTPLANAWRKVLKVRPSVLRDVAGRHQHWHHCVALTRCHKFYTCTVLLRNLLCCDIP